MRRTVTFLVALTLAAGLSSAAAAQKLDANGKCHAADGKFAKAEVCASLKAAPAAHCRDMKTKKFAKCGAPNTEPVPAKKK